jgi:hypothetical protein
MKTLTENKLIDRIHENFGYRYDTKYIKYIDKDTDVELLCPIHGIFYSKPSHLLNGYGSCPLCNISRGEMRIMVALDNLGIKYQKEKTFDWLIHDIKMRLDFYIIKYNIAIEYQGRQHFEIVNFGNVCTNEIDLSNCIRRDKIKKELCESHGIRLFYINYNDDIDLRISEILQEIGWSILDTYT